MLQICRAQDGVLFQVEASVWDIERLGSLELFLQQETHIDQDAVVAYLSDGRLLRTDNLRELAGSADQYIFVFNKDFLEEDPDDVLRILKIEPPLEPPIEDAVVATPPIRPAQLGASYLHAAHTHQQSIAHLVHTLHNQHDALGIALSNLDSNILTMSNTYDVVITTAQRELERQATLLSGVQTDLGMIERVPVHRDFVSPAVRRVMDQGGEGRTLGAYVDAKRMLDVAGRCTAVHENLKKQYRDALDTMQRLRNGAFEAREKYNNTELIDAARKVADRSQEAYDKIAENAAALESPVAHPEGILHELRELDAHIRESVSAIAELKNEFTKQCLEALSQISLLNHELVDFTPTLTNLSTSLRAKNSFLHIQRLHNMLQAYGATIIEIVRRKEFARFFYQRAQVILEVMAKLTSSEKKRRQFYRGELHGLLPFDIHGMNGPVPAIDFTPTGGDDLDSPYNMEREDVDKLMNILNEVEDYARSLNDNGAALNTIQETKVSLEKSIAKMDGMESNFDRIAERSLISSSRLALSKRRLSEVDEHAFQEVLERLRATEQAKNQQEVTFNSERTTMQAEISRLQAQLEEARDTSSAEQERADRLERDLHHARGQAESEAASRRIIDERHQQLLAEMTAQKMELSQALAEATNQTKAAEVLRQQLAQTQAEFEEVKALEARNEERMTALLNDQAENLTNLEEARARGEDLQAQIRAARQESDDVKRAVEEAKMEKDRMLKAQASEHERQMRDYVAEADGDRAVLEHQFFELRAEVEDMERQVKEATAQVEMREADANGLREELQRTECELRDARQVENVLREDIRAGRASQSDFEHKLEESNRLVAQLLDVAIAYRTSLFKASSLVQAATSHPPMSKSVMHLGDPFSAGPRSTARDSMEEPTPLDPSDPAAAIELLRTFDHDHFLEIMAKPGSTIRKWTKQCKEYRERAKSKISFRNFSKGDLALFLPTRNSISKPWAAFNVSFPHYFLQPTGQLGQSLKTREWIVARITSITERVVDSKDPTSNPYGLGDGVRYYLLEVEDWTQSAISAAKRRSSAPSKTTVESKETSTAPLSPPSELTPRPPQNEVEEAFEVTRAPNSHLFPVVRSRSNSNPAAGPSSLSKLLAQAGPATETQSNGDPGQTSERQALTPIPPSPNTPPRSPSPAIATSPSAMAPSPPSYPIRPNLPSPLRPGSRASRLSTSSSRFSAGRLPAFGSASSGTSAVAAVKAAPTTALSGSSGSPGVAEEQTQTGTANTTPSPAESAGEGLSSILHARRRTSSYHVQPRSPLSTAATTPSVATMDRPSSGSAFASLASWGTAFGRRKRSEMSSEATRVSQVDASGQAGQVSDRNANDEGSTTAKDLLKRF